MISRQIIHKASLYILSIFIFWNTLVAIRAYRFTHFKSTNTIAVNTAGVGMIDYTLQRLSGPQYYKLPVKYFPNLPFENVQLETSNQLKLAGWYMKQENSKGTVIVFHGLGGNRESMLTESNALYKMGFNIFTIDFRAHGNSEGSSSTIGVKEAEDVKIAYEYILNKGEKNIILYGASMGAASIASCLHTYNNVQPSKVVLDMPFENYQLLIEKFYQNSKYPKEPTFTLFTFWASVFHQQWLFNMKPSNYVKSIKCPVLLQWGVNDDLVPEKSTQKIYNNINAPKELVIYQNSGHESFCNKESALWHQKVGDFLQL